MKFTKVWLAVVVFCLIPTAFAQMSAEKIDTATVSKIKDEGMNRSQVMEILSYLTDVHGPRLTWSPEYKQAAVWANGKLREWGLQNIHNDNFAPVGKGWTLKEFSAQVVEPKTFPIIAYPRAWSPAFGSKKADVVYLDVKTVADFEKYKGKLRGKFILMNEPVEITAHFSPEGSRVEDSLLVKMANAGPPVGGGRGGARRFAQFMNIQDPDSLRMILRQFAPNMTPAQVERMVYQRLVEPKKLEFVQQEKALAALAGARGDGGTIFVQQATVPQPQSIPFNQRINAYDQKAPEIISQIAVAAEHYNRMIRMIEKGQKLKIEMNFEVEWTKADSGFNVIAEIPGTDLKDEVVMLGAHFDSWHGGTGATDNGTGSAVCLEAVRIIKTLGLRPRRTIRIGLWGGEEQGLIGSREYVAEVFGKLEGDQTAQMFGMAEPGTLKTTPAYDNFSVYFNNDNGTGKVRGVHMQGNEATRPIFRAWLNQYGDPTAQTLTLQNTGGTDHLAFDAIGLPGFQYIQDPIEYDTRTHHSTMDVWDRAQVEDLKQAASIMAVFVYNAAQRDDKFPRKPRPTTPQRAVGSN